MAHRIDVIVTENMVGATPVIATVTPIGVVAVGPRGEKGERGPSGSAAQAKAGSQETPSMTWIMDHDLGSYPAGFKFLNTDGDFLVPEDIVYATENRVIAVWPEPIAGTWYVS